MLRRRSKGYVLMLGSDLIESRKMNIKKNEHIIYPGKTLLLEGEKPSHKYVSYILNEVATNNLQLDPQKNSISHRYMHTKELCFPLSNFNLLFKR